VSAQAKNYGGCPRAHAGERAAWACVPVPADIRASEQDSRVMQVGHMSRMSGRRGSAQLGEKIARLEHDFIAY
jgi:hypothetical protein